MNSFAKLMYILAWPIRAIEKITNSVLSATELVIDVVIASYNYIISTTWWKKADNFCIEFSELYTEIQMLVAETGIVNLDDTVKVMIIKIAWAIIHAIFIAIVLAILAVIFLVGFCEPC